MNYLNFLTYNYINNLAKFATYNYVFHNLHKLCCNTFVIIYLYIYKKKYFNIQNSFSFLSIIIIFYFVERYKKIT